MAKGESGVKPCPFEGIEPALYAPAMWEEGEKERAPVEKNTDNLACAAVERALENSRLTSSPETMRRSGCIFATLTGLSASFEAYGVAMHRKDYSFIRRTDGFGVLANCTLMRLVKEFGFKGTSYGVTGACAGSSMAIGQAYRLIQDGAEERVIAGGADEASPIHTVFFQKIYAASQKLKDSPAPFDQDRDGTVTGAGAGALVIEDRESALLRGAGIAGEIIGFACNCNGGNYITPNADMEERCMAAALNDAGLEPHEIDYVIAHATGTVAGDQAELDALNRIFPAECFGAHLRPDIQSFKGHLGHTLSASGAIESVIGIKAAQLFNLGMLPRIRTLNLKNPMRGFSDRNVKRERSIKVIMKNAFGVGGINTTLIYRVMH